MSRRHSHDPGFGSDSFLDVLANMVGILIILIVLVGLLTDIIPYRLRNPTAEHMLDQRRLGWRLLPLSHPAAPIVTE